MNDTHRRGQRLAALAVGLTCLALPCLAAADDGPGQVRIALDIDYTIALGEGDTDNGAGGALRAGYALDLAGVSLTPEIGLAYHGFDGTLSPAIYRAFVGARASFGAGLRPGFFARFGVAHSSDDDDSRTVPTAGGGLMLDFTLLPKVDLGVHTGYENLFGNDDTDAFDWWTFGVHAAVAF